MRKNFLPNLASVLSFVTLACLAFVSNQSWAQHYETTFTLQQPLNGGNVAMVDTIRYTWKTNVTSGLVTESDLDSLTMELFSGGNTVYMDVMIVNGVFEDFGGAPRAANDIFWRFDLDANQLLEGRNVNTAQSGSLGEQFYVEDLNPYDTSDRVGIFRFVDGVSTNNNGYLDLVETQTTQFIPPPVDSCFDQILAVQQSVTDLLANGNLSQSDLYRLSCAEYYLTAIQDPVFWETDDRLSVYGGTFFIGAAWAVAWLDSLDDQSASQPIVDDLMETLELIVDKEIEYAIMNDGNGCYIDYAEAYADVGDYINDEFDRPVIATLAYRLAWLHAYYSTY